MAEVSVIVPIYNDGQFLEQSIKSILSQSFQDIEVILVDDGATDNSYAICQQYAKADDRIQLLVQEHQGEGAARNNGLTHAHADLVTFVEGHDFVDRDYIQTLHKQMAHYHSDIAMMSHLIVHSNGATYLPTDPYNSDRRYDGLYTPEQWLKIGFEEQGIIDVTVWGKL